MSSAHRFSDVFYQSMVERYSGRLLPSQPKEYFVLPGMRPPLWFPASEVLRDEKRESSLDLSSIFVFRCGNAEERILRCLPNTRRPKVLSRAAMYASKTEVPWDDFC